MLAILIFSWIVSVLFVVLAERNNGYSSSLSHDEKIKRIREKRRRVEQESDEIDAKWREYKLKRKEFNQFLKDLHKQYSVNSNVIV